MQGSKSLRPLVKMLLFCILYEKLDVKYSIFIVVLDFCHIYFDNVYVRIRAQF